MEIPSPATKTSENLPEYPPPQPPNKKTRELPNLSDCNCCNRRINSTNPKNRLGILTSQWRIVLLCKSCYSLVESSQFCSYCLTRVSSGFYECKKCRRRIHKDCVSRFSLGFSGNCDEFSVCFDCWMPSRLENEYNRNRLVRIGTGKKELGKNGVDSVSLANLGFCSVQEKGKGLENDDNRNRTGLSGTSEKKLRKNGVESTLLASSGLCNLQEKGKGSENVVNEANVVAEKKVVIAIEAKQKAFRKVMEAKKAMEVASGALGIVAIDKGGDQVGYLVDEDAQLAIRLHREMNSSPRISRNLCSVNTHCVDLPKVNGSELRGANGMSCGGREMIVGLGANGREMGCLLGRDRKGLNGDGQKYGDSVGRVQNENRNGDSKDCVITYIRRERAAKVVKCKKEVNPSLKVYSRKLFRVKLEAGARPCQVVKLEVGQCSKTYIRRRLHSKNKLINGSVNLEDGILAPDMSLTCCEQSRALTNAS